MPGADRPEMGDTVTIPRGGQAWRVEAVTGTVVVLKRAELTGEPRSHLDILVLPHGEFYRHRRGAAVCQASTR